MPTIQKPLVFKCRSDPIVFWVSKNARGNVVKGRIFTAVCRKASLLSILLLSSFAAVLSYKQQVSALNTQSASCSSNKFFLSSLIFFKYLLKLSHSEMIERRKQDLGEPPIIIVCCPFYLSVLEVLGPMLSCISTSARWIAVRYLEHMENTWICQTIWDSIFWISSIPLAMPSTLSRFVPI